MLVEEFRIQSLSQAEKAYILLVSLFIGVLLLTNIITSKYITVARLTFTAGVITYPFTFSLLDIIAEIYGRNRAQMVIWMGLVASLFMALITYVANIIPVYEHSPVPQTSFHAVFGFTPGIVVGSMIAYLASQFVDIYLLGLLRRLTNGKHLWIRNNISTLVGQLIDTAIFAGIAWILWPRIGFSQALDPISWDTWYQITLNEYGFKIAFTLLNTPLVYGGIYLIRRYIRTT